MTLQTPNFKTVEFTISSNVADDGTFTVNYPDNFDDGDFENASGHYIVINGAKLTQPNDIGIAFNTGSMTITNRTGAAILAGTGHLTLYLGGKQAQHLVAEAYTSDNDIMNNVMINATKVEILRVNLGSPLTADPNGICASQNVAAAGALTLNGALVSGGEAVLDKPRNIVVDSGGADTATLTITGEDEYEQPMSEDIQLNGATAVAGVKAFKKVTSVTSDGATTNGVFVGTGDVLGLPVRIPRTTDVLIELEDGAKVGDFQSLDGTVVAGLAKNTEQTATTADPRGTYDPNTAMDGTTSIELILMVPDPLDIGNKQYVAS